MDRIEKRWFHNNANMFGNDHVKSPHVNITSASCEFLCKGSVVVCHRNRCAVSSVLMLFVFQSHVIHCRLPIMHQYNTLCARGRIVALNCY